MACRGPGHRRAVAARGAPGAQARPRGTDASAHDPTRRRCGVAAAQPRLRGKDKPTNVLSFPAAASGHGYLGDIAMAYGVSVREAREAGKTLCDHASHLAVHGVLHLLGYDHEADADANLMEPLEVAILAELGIADPYAARPVHVA